MGIIRAIATDIFKGIADMEFKYFISNNYSNPFFRKIQFRLQHIRYKKHFRVGEQVYIKYGKNLIVGDRCSIGSFSKIWDYAPIEIGNDFMAAGCLIMNSGSHDVNTLTPFASPIVIGERVWCGVNVTILAGITIGNDVVIGAGSLVVNDIPDKSVAVGVPAKVVKTIEREDSELYRQHDWT